MNKLLKLTQEEIKIWTDVEQRNCITNPKTSYNAQQTFEEFIVSAFKTPNIKE